MGGGRSALPHSDHSVLPDRGKPHTIMSVEDRLTSQSPDWVSIHLFSKEP
jgi:hypothetical protein